MSSPQNDHISELQALEKKYRLAEDRDNTRSTALELLDLCRQVSVDRALTELSTLVKKRLQQPETITAIVRHVLSWTDDFTGQDESSIQIKRRILTTVRDASAGKLTVEKEHALAIRQLSNQYVSLNDIDSAAKEIKDLSPEQIGAFTRSERIEMILYQVDLFLKTKDFIRAEISFRKITIRSLQHEDVEPRLRVMYFFLATRIALIRDDYYTTSSAFYDLFISSKSLSSDDSVFSLSTGSLASSARYLLLTELGPERNTLAGRVVEEVVKTGQELKEVALLHKTLGTLLVDLNEVDALPNDEDTGEHVRGWRELVKRGLVDHNITVVSKFFSLVSFSKFAELVQATEEFAEERLTVLFANNVVYCKINRLERIISFEKEKSSTAVVNEWSFALMGAIEKVDRTVHLIEVEQSLAK
ncbi:hypothetical protein P9112_000336 [Eukaryota sp. TZLM1-RC]